MLVGIGLCDVEFVAKFVVELTKVELVTDPVGLTVLDKVLDCDTIGLPDKEVMVVLVEEEVLLTVGVPEALVV